MAGGSHNEDFTRRMARRTRLNEESTLAYLVSMLAIAVVFMLLHLVRRLGQRLSEGRTQTNKTTVLASLSRYGSHHLGYLAVKLSLTPDAGRYGACQSAVYLAFLRSATPDSSLSTWPSTSS